MRSKRFRVVLTTLYVVGFSVILYFLVTGIHYYLLDPAVRPRAAGHRLLKPGGLIGHTLGIAGSMLLLLLFTYTLRKKGKFGLRRGKLARWLDIHIWMGIMGPLLITLHSAFKFHGIVTVSYFSMMAVMLSGFLGRYIYIQIPRDDRGIALPIEEIDKHIGDMSRSLADRYDVPSGLIDVVNEGSGELAAVADEGARGLAGIVVSDVLRPIRKYRLHRRIRTTYPEIPRATVNEIVRLAGRRAIMVRRRVLLQVATSVFHLWHVVHKPFAVVMVAIMLIHVAVVVAMGYRWVF